MKSADSIKKRERKSEKFKTSLALGFFLAIRQIKRSSIGTTALIVFVMTLTFLNLVVVYGILVGLIQGSVDVFKENFYGDISISSLPRKEYIEKSPEIIEIVKGLPWLQSYSARYTKSGTVEGTYKERIDYTEKANIAGGLITGIDPIREDQTTQISKFIVEGRYLTPEDSDGVILGANTLRKYFDIDSAELPLLENVNIGDKVRISVNNNLKEVTVIGVIKSKAEFDSRIVMLDTSVRNLIGRTDYNVNEIAIRTKPFTDPYLVKNALIQSGVGKTASVQTFEEGLPKFLKDIQDTFGLLGNVVGSIGLVVASITIFIVIYINAITRRKFIGILKGIGINSVAIEFSYILQSLFYAVMGIILGMAILYGFLVPYIDANPINFPFSDGILVANLGETLVRAGLLLIATIFAGFIPARLVVKQNTLDAILGR